MNIVKSVLPLLSIFNLDNGRETAVTTRPALPDWLPAGGDLVPHPGQQVKSITRRVIQDRNVTIFEQHVEYVTTPEPAPERQRPYTFETYTGGAPELSPGETAQVVADWHAGRARWVGGPPDPDQALRNAFGARRRPARVENGRIVLSE